MKQTLRKINKLFEKADELLSSLSNEEQERILQIHNENHSLNHCIRWGLQASEELVEIENRKRSK